jgi:anti-anti-sigma regulatory factor
MRTMEQVVREGNTMRRFFSTLMIAFSVVALVLAMVGLYGLIAYSVAQRRIEIGVLTVDHFPSHVWQSITSQMKAQIKTTFYSLHDASAAGFVSRVLDVVMDSPTDSSVVLDLSQVEFCDGAGVLALAAIERTLAPRPLILRSPRRFVTRLLAITDFQHLVGA